MRTKPAKGFMNRNDRSTHFAPTRLRLSFLAPIVFLVSLSGCQNGDASPIGEMPAKYDAPAVEFVGSALDIDIEGCESAILIDVETNSVLFEKNPNEARPPASIVKMMLELVAMREIEAGRLALSDSVRVSRWSSKMGGSQVYLAEGEVFPLEELMKAVAISSANDACVAIAEHVAGTTRGFVELMNREAKSLGLEATRYENVHGLDDVPDKINVTTAADIAQLGRELVRYPEVLTWSSTERALFRDGDFVLENTNKLLGKFNGLDGLKTGFTSKAGFCLCATAIRGDTRLISVVMGCESNRERFRTTSELLGLGFGGYLRMPICSKEDPLDETVAIAGAKGEPITPVAARDLVVVVSRPDDRHLTTRFVADEMVQAPLEAWDQVGVLQAVVDDRVLAEVPVLTPLPVEAAGLLAWAKGLIRR